MMYFKYKHSVIQLWVKKTKTIKSYEFSELVRQNIGIIDPIPVH